MTLLLPRRSVLAGLASLFALPALVRATSLDLVRGTPFALSPDGLLSPRSIADFSSELNYEYWVSFGGALTRMTAREILAAPPGVLKPWLGSHTGLVRPVSEASKGLAYHGGKFTVLPSFSSDPELASLRSERDRLLGELQLLRAKQKAEEAATAFIGVKGNG